MILIHRLFVDYKLKYVDTRATDQDCTPSECDDARFKIHSRGFRTTVDNNLDEQPEPFPIDSRIKQVNIYIIDSNQVQKWTVDPGLLQTGRPLEKNRQYQSCQNHLQLNSAKKKTPRGRPGKPYKDCIEEELRNVGKQENILKKGG
ncbi:hypothetical protein EVAR_75569_1 [Eumeta japonica]|uniref:Uncharacterized protein n=1 Tax=Eumeta variegata TaxID=151549 RepID=A0A4C1UK10_EUMVA|nr:hypothetical protein EVAR_75569_1 [Eumeta japonica]